ncbi:MAG: AAA family ATPase [Gammaproteobacteria bacterium]|nr:AAA family ATPase [Gammaproteobacteria bacterium]
MYKNNYLKLEDPFRFCPDENSAFQYHSYLSGIEFLQNIIDYSKKNIVLVSGATGVGKSTLINDFLRRQHNSRVLSAVLQAGHINSGGFMSAISHVIEEDAEDDDRDLIHQFDQYLARIKSQHICLILVIEDAHELGGQAMTTLGKISRLVSDNKYGMKVFLTSKHSVNKLQDHVRNDGLFKKHVAGWNLRGLGINDISIYVEHRLENAGGEITLKIDKNGWQTIYRYSEGIPRRVNRICNRLLLKGQFESKEIFDNNDIIDVINQLDTEGLLEVSRLFASIHGLVGSSEDDIDKSCEPDLCSFFAGFTAPILIENKPEYAEPDHIVNGKEKTENIILYDVPHDDIKLSSEMRDAKIIPIRPDLDTAEIRDPIEPIEPIEPVVVTHQRKSILFLSLIAVIVFFILVLYSVTLPDKSRLNLFDSHITNDNKQVLEEKKPPEEALIRRKSIPVQKTPVLINKIQTLISLKNLDNEKGIKPSIQENIVVTKDAVEVISKLPEIKVPFKSKKIIRRSYTEKQLIKMLMGGFWRTNGLPAVLLPSELNKCTTGDTDIYCLAKGVNGLSGSGFGKYNTGAMLSDFSSYGRFTVIYRSVPSKESNNAIVSPEESTEYEMQCKFISKGKINCTKDGARLRYILHNNN